MRTVVISCMRNEGPWLLEWVAHYQELGFTGIWICSNDLTDGSAELLDRLDALKVIRHFRNPVQPGEAPQVIGFEHMRADPEFLEYDWALVADADEFLVLPDISLPRFLAARDRASAIAINWKVFGHDGQVKHRPGLVTERFRSCVTDGPAAHYKCFTRPRDTRALTMHFPVLVAGRLFIQANGTPLPGEPNGLLPQPDHSHGWINHYIAKSLEEMCAKTMRGRGARGGTNAAFTVADLRADDDPAGGNDEVWRSVGFMASHALLGGTIDLGIARYRPGVTARMATLARDAEVLAALHGIEERYQALLASVPARTLLASVVDRVFFRVVGRVERLADGVLHGWIGRPIGQLVTRCLVMVDRAFVAETVPEPRVDAGGQRTWGYAVRLPAHLVDGRRHLVTVHAIHDGAHIGACSVVVLFKDQAELLAAVQAAPQAAAPVPPEDPVTEAAVVAADQPPDAVASLEPAIPAVPDPVVVHEAPGSLVVPPAAPAPPPTCKGNIDGVVNGELTGWVSTAADDQVAHCLIGIDGGAAQPAVPHLLREDLRASGIGDGLRGFGLPLTPAQIDGRPHTVELTAFVGGEEVGRLVSTLVFFNRIRTAAPPLPVEPAPAEPSAAQAEAPTGAKAQREAKTQLKAQARAAKLKKAAKLKQTATDGPSRPDTPPPVAQAEPAAQPAAAKAAALREKRAAKAEAKAHAKAKVKEHAKAKVKEHAKAKVKAQAKAKVKELAKAKVKAQAKAKAKELAKAKVKAQAKAKPRR